MQNNYIDILFEFLQTPLESGDKIIEKFASLPDAVVGKGPEALQRYVYIPIQFGIKNIKNRLQKNTGLYLKTVFSKALKMNVV